MSIRAQVHRQMEYLNEGSQQGGDIPLVRLQVALQEGVEVEQNELVHAHDARDERDHCCACLHLLAAALLEPHKQLFGKGLQALQILRVCQDVCSCFARSQKPSCWLQQYLMALFNWAQGSDFCMCSMMPIVQPASQTHYELIILSPLRCS